MNEAKKGVNPEWQAALSRLDGFLRPKPPADREGRSITEGLEPRARELVSGVLRHRSRLESFWAGHVKKAPKGQLRTLLLLALWDVVRGDRTQSLPQVVHHAVTQIAFHCSTREKNFANAVLRKVAPLARERWESETTPRPSEWPVYFSHPPELVRRWQKARGLEATKDLLVWNNTPGENFLRWRDSQSSPPESCPPTKWKEFYHLPAAAWPEVRRFLESGQAYIQDPATRALRECLADFKGESFLDTCAAPGGKTLLAADTLQLAQKPNFTFVAMDKEGPRLQKLVENLKNASLQDRIPILQGDLRENLADQLTGAELPASYDAVLLDVPCSNTGVFRRRPEARWHWSEKALAALVRQQETFLQNGASVVASGGLLLYSTCSIEEEENQGVVSRFLHSPEGQKFILEKSWLFSPWKDQHDGAGLFALRRLSK